MLINNAGIAIGKPLLELSDENIERIFKINAISHFWVFMANEFYLTLYLYK